MTRRTRVALTGASGQLGRAMTRLAPASWEIFGTSSRQVDIRSWQAVRDWIATVRPHLVIHAGAMTDVDGCELDEANAFAVNALGTRHVAGASEQFGATCVYVSTNFVFDGTKPAAYHEFDTPRPISVYGHSKLAGETEAQQVSEPTYIIRTAMVFDEQGRNFVNTMQKLMSERDELKVVADQFGNPTYAADLATGIMRIIDELPPATYHLANAGTASWFDWASEIREISGHDTKIVRISAADFPRAATPPANGCLTSIALSESNVGLPDWRDALRRCLS